MEKKYEMESEAEACALQRSPSTLSINTRSKLMRLKRPLMFIRSRSVENFFQRSYSDARLPSDIIEDVPPLSPPLPSDSPVLGDSFKSSLSPSHSEQKPHPVQTHCFMDYVFRRPTSCQLCKHVIVGNSKQGLRCRTCKIAAHLWCTADLSQQPCQGKAGMFKRNFSTPSITSDQLAVRETLTTLEVRGRVDPVYAMLRYGTSLAHIDRSSFGSVCESPTRSVGEGGEEKDTKDKTELDVVEQINEDPEADPPESERLKDETEDGFKVPKFHSIHTYVALYKFLPQELNDLELHPGDRVQVTDDSNEEWWKGKCGDRLGFFPAKFVQRLRPGESVWRVTQGVHGDRQLGQMTVREDQICVGKKEDSDGYLRLCSGKKRGLVPTHSLEEI